MENNIKFINILEQSIKTNTFVKLILGKYRGENPNLKRILIKKLKIKGQDNLCFIYCNKTNEITKNMTIEDGIKEVSGLFENPFKSANLFSLTEDIQIEFSKKGKCSWGQSKPSINTLPTEKHNHEKHRFININSQFLLELGITNDKQCVVASMSRKWKQINKFIEIFDSAFQSSELSNKNIIDVVDFGSGKGYLTFAVEWFLRETIKVTSNVMGIELREDLVNFCNEITHKLKINSLHFHQGDIKNYSPKNINIMIALHACDIATDLAINMGIQSNAEIIMCAPCCHKEIRKQMDKSTTLQPILKFGVHLGQEAEMITDSLRALLLELNGYKTQIFEFISLEHTSKNKMLLAIKHNRTVNKTKILKDIKTIKDFYNIKNHYLENLLECKINEGVL